jgi:lipopolysaccharide export system permease protein
MKKLIFRKFILDHTKFLLSSLIIMSVIIWTIQAVNFFDFVTEDGHGLKIYFFYTILNFPKIIHRILPFVYFISLFYIIRQYEIKNELNIFWINGISKLKLAKELVFFSFVIMIFQIFIGSSISPKFQNDARSYLKNSNVDFFSSLLKQGKFINITKGLTIFINKKNEDGTYSEIFLEDSLSNSSKMIYAKKAILIDDTNIKVLKLFNGKVINKNLSKVNIFEFEKIDFNLNNLVSNTITVPKIQEMKTSHLISCFVDNIKNKIEFVVDCNKDIKTEIKQELIKRLVKPIYIPLITLLCCYQFLYSRFNTNFNKKINYIFFANFLLILLSEVSLRYSSKSNITTFLYLLIPFALYIIFYFIFSAKSKNA